MSLIAVDQLLWRSISSGGSGTSFCGSPYLLKKREKKKKNERGRGKGGEERRRERKRGATGEATTPIKVFSHYAWPRRKYKQGSCGQYNKGVNFQKILSRGKI